MTVDMLTDAGTITVPRRASLKGFESEVPPHPSQKHDDDAGQGPRNRVARVNKGAKTPLTAICGDGGGGGGERSASERFAAFAAH